MVLHIAYGENLIYALDEQDIEQAVLHLKRGEGDIVDYDPLNDNIEELFQHIRFSSNFREVSEEELIAVNNFNKIK